MMPDYDQIPESTKDSLARWVSDGIRPGSFVCSVLANDLFGAFKQADHRNIAAMFHIVCFVYNELPNACWGSPEQMQIWHEAKKVEREERALGSR